MIKELNRVREYRDIKITSKRQLTIPKSFFDALNIEDEVEAYLLDDGIFLKPIRKRESVYDQDIQTIIQNVLSQDLPKEEMAKELTKRITEYNEFLAARVQEFKDDMVHSESEEDEGDFDFNGLDVFFNEENGETFEKN